MAGTFDDRISELADRVGAGKLTARVEVDQIYARFQHEGLDLHHPDGGQAKYLEQPWLEHGTDFARRWAKALLESDGLHEEMRAVAEDGVRMVDEHAPVEFGDLRQSGHPSVIDDGKVVFDRPPVRPRLTEVELDVKDRERRHGGVGVGRAVNPGPSRRRR